MTGKQCIFCGSQSSSASKDNTFSVFMAMPFRPNLSTSYSWSLKPYLLKGLSEGETKKVNIMRADEYPHIGAITCEKICRPIQSADLVVVDITLPNANVMYELGLAIGLGKEILLVRNSPACDEDGKGFAEALLQYLNEGARQKDTFKALNYPGVGFIDGEKYPPKSLVSTLHLPARAVTKLKVVGLAQSLAVPRAAGDVTVAFASMVDGAIGVALKSILAPPKTDDSEEAKRAHQVAKAASLKDTAKTASMKDAAKADGCQIEIKAEGVKEGGKYTYVALIGSDASSHKSFKTVREEIDDAFCCVMDLAGESAAAYLWLGYCHARGINVIPVYRRVEGEEPSILFRPCPRHEEHEGSEESKEQGDPAKSRGKEGSKGRPADVLAFDIRALWYIDFQHNKTEYLADLLRSVFIELIIRDLPRLERNRFWSRLTQNGEVRIYTGAIHNKDLKREMVGDWDQRTVSELVRYLSSTDEAVTPVLEPPIYAPEYGLTRTSAGAAEKAAGLSTEELSKYIARVKSSLQDKNCIVVASADVNALTEILLAHAYCDKHDGTSMFAGPTIASDNAVIALKPPPGNATPAATKPVEPEAAVEASSNKPAARRKGATPAPAAREGLPRVYSRSAQDEGDERKRLGRGFRGFRIGYKAILKTHYCAQEEELFDLGSQLVKIAGANHSEPPQGGVKGFLLLSHLLIMQNPFLSDERRAAGGPPPLIVVLNGVSGPGTYALAEVLTGGGEMPESKENGNAKEGVDKACASERLLREINRLLDEMVTSGKSVVQGIVWVAISRQPGQETGVGLYDSRGVHSWEWCAAARSGSEEGKEEACVVPKDANPWIC